METTTVHTTCTMDCPDGCALEVHVRDGRIQSIRGGKDHPDTDGFICGKIARFDRRVYHDKRVLHPMRRTGPKGSGTFSRIGWDEALGEIGERFRQIQRDHGAEAIVPYHYGGSNGLLGDGFLDDYFFAKLGASRLGRTLCAAPTGAVSLGMYGKMPGVAFGDYVHARFILLWGANPKASNIHLLPYLREAKRRGAFVAVVDPRRVLAGAEADLHLAVRPGTDLALALAMIREWDRRGQLAREHLAEHATGLDTLLSAAGGWTLEAAAERCGVAASDIEALAAAYAGASPAVVRCGWGVERNRNGGQAVAAILAMPALLGKFGVRGGGYTLSNSASVRLDHADTIGPYEWATRCLNMSELGAQLTGDLDPPIKAMFVYNCNPVATAPDQNRILRGLERDDLFTVVHEQVMTDTALYADLVLPAPTFVEQYEIKRAYGSYAVGGVQPAIEPVGEAMPNEALFAALGREMGFSEAPFQWDTAECMERICDAMRLGDDPGDPTVLTSGRIQRTHFQGELPVQLVTTRPRTPDGKIHLAPECLGKRPYAFLSSDDASHPLALISSASAKMISSTFGEDPNHRLRLRIHPRDASARGIGIGDWVRVFNGLGEVICEAEVSDRIRPGVTELPKGAWRHATANGQTATALAPAHVNVVAGGACYNDAKVEVVRLSEPPR